MDVSNLTELHIDALREIGNIGAGNAATSMATLINRRIKMEVPSVKIISFDDMMQIVGGPEELIVAMYFKIYGEVPSSVYLILSLEEAETLINRMVGDIHVDLQREEVDEFALSALKEVGNIITGSYISALSDFINIHMQSSIPHLSIDMAGALLTVGLIELSQVSDYAILIDTEIQEGNASNGVHGHFFLLPEPKSFPKLFSALGISQDG